MSYRMAVVIAPVFISGCTVSPSLVMVGAYFPDWLFCMSAGVLLTTVARIVTIRTGIEAFLGLQIVVYPTLTVLFSLLTWLLLFK